MTYLIECMGLQAAEMRDTIERQATEIERCDETIIRAGIREKEWAAQIECQAAEIERLKTYLLNAEKAAIDLHDKETRQSALLKQCREVLDDVANGQSHGIARRAGEAIDAIEECEHES